LSEQEQREEAWRREMDELRQSHVLLLDFLLKNILSPFYILVLFVFVSNFLMLILSLSFLLVFQTDQIAVMQRDHSSEISRLHEHYKSSADMLMRQTEEAATLMEKAQSEAEAKVAAANAGLKQ
jgi:hypothetical protein